MDLSQSTMPHFLSLTHSLTHSLHIIHSFYEVFVVESKVPPDTSTIAADSDNVFIALADDAEPRMQLPEFFFGDGTRDVYTVQDGSQIEFENRELRGGTVYYFFIRLHSSVVSIFLRPFLIVTLCSTAGCGHFQ